MIRATPRRVSMDMKTVLILGGAGGVGRALGARLAADGWRVTLAGRGEARLREAASPIGAAIAVCDVTAPETLDAAIAAATGEEGLSALAYCVGSIPLKPFAKTTGSDFAEAYALNVIGAAEALRRAESALAHANGAAVLFSTVAAATGFPNHAAIAAAKAGIEGLTRALAAEWAGRVRVNAVAPSLTRTPLAAFLADHAQMAKAIAALHPIPRLGEAEDVAAAAAFLLSAEASWITGQILPVDGGRGALRHKN